MNILILGGTSFTGPHIVRALAARGHDVSVLHRGQHGADLPPGVRTIRADIAELPRHAAALRGLRFDVVIHMIAMSAGDARAAVDTFAGHVGRIVVASSQDVYAAFGALLGKETREPSSLPITEESPLRTSRSLHGDSYEKIEVEELFTAASDRLPTTILRMPATYGPNDPRHRFYPAVKRFLDQRPAILLEPAHGNFRWSHAYVENVAHAFALAATHDAAVGRTFNISEPRTPTIGERLHELARVAKYKGQIIVVPRDRCPPSLIHAEDFRHDVIVSDAALRQTLGYQEVIPADEALRRTLDWQRHHAPEQVNSAEFDYAAEDAFLRSVGLVRP